MCQLINGIRRFQREVFVPQRKFFQELAQGQQPSAMVITCSDARIDPALLMQTRPGELFVARNVGNVVPVYDRLRPDAIAAAVEFAVVGLQVQQIIVLGHSQCGAATTYLDDRTGPRFPIMRRWLRHMKPLRNADLPPAHETAGERLDAFIRHNAIVQRDHLLSHPAVLDAVSRRGLELHAWVYELQSGRVLAHDAALDEYVALGERSTHDVPSGDTCAAQAGASDESWWS
ncbi:MAG TPA: carbonic anhydrase [Pirellulales bacterium]|jgi:carbonic anhydrase